ncbi:MAG: hypothetical protein AB1657_01090 [Candidatus Micrarchaeota archaeon]
MVHGLNIIVGLNRNAGGKGGPSISERYGIPRGIALHPRSAREFVNRPWGQDELAGPDLRAAYRRSDRPFGNKDCREEGRCP